MRTVDQINGMKATELRTILAEEYGVSGISRTAVAELKEMLMEWDAIQLAKDYNLEHAEGTPEEVLEGALKEVKIITVREAEQPVEIITAEEETGQETLPGKIGEDLPKEDNKQFTATIEVINGTSLMIVTEDEKPKTKTAQVVELHEQGLTRSQIAKAVGCRYQMVDNILRKKGLISK